MARYALDVTLSLGRRTGIGRLVEELVAGVTPLLQDDETLTLVARTFRLNPLLGTSHERLRRWAEHPRLRVCRIPLPSRLIVGTPIEKFAGDLDVVHGPASALPALRTARGVVTIQDLGPLRHPEHVGQGRFAAAIAAGFDRAVRDAVRRAARVLTTSAFTANEVVELLGVPRERIETVRLAAAPAFAAMGDADRRAAAERLDRPRPFVLFVGTTNPRKNLPRLLDAFAIARSRASLPHDLVLAGNRGLSHIWPEIVSRRLADVVHVAGYVDEEHLRLLYGAADALAFPSLYEGFGLPVVEAMAAACPVLTSTTSSLPEVAGDAAVLVDPTSVEAIADGLVRVLTDSALRERLVAAGRRRAAEFSWEAIAARHLAIWREVAAEGHASGTARR